MYNKAFLYRAKMFEYVDIVYVSVRRIIQFFSRVAENGDQDKECQIHALLSFIS